VREKGSSNVFQNFDNPNQPKESLGRLAARLLNLTINVLDVLEDRPALSVGDACDSLGLGDQGRWVRQILCRLDLVAPPEKVGFREGFAALLQSRFSTEELPEILVALNPTALDMFEQGMRDMAASIAAREAGITVSFREVPCGA
jgi:hypothetical protein